MRRSWVGVALGGILAAAGGAGCEDDSTSPAALPDGGPGLQLDGGGTLGDGGDVGPGDAGTDGTTNGDAGDAGPVEVVAAYVACGTGLDTNTGKIDAPLKTLAKAATVAPAGTTIVVLDGECNPTTEPAFNTVNGKVTLPDGVSLRAANTGAVTFKGITGLRSAGVHFAGSGRIAGVRFETFGTAITASSGEVTVEGVTFDDIGQGFPIDATGTSKVTVRPGGLTNYIGTNQTAFAQVKDNAELTLVGGTIRGAKDSGISGVGQLMVRNAGKLVLDGTTLIDSTFTGISAHETGTVVVRNKSVIDNVASNACCNQAAINLAATARLDLIDSTIIRSPHPGILLRQGTPTVNLDKAKIESGSNYAIVAAIYSESRPTITIKDSEIKNNRGGLFLNYASKLDIAGSSIVDNGNVATGCNHGIHLNGGGEVNTVKLRGTSVRGNCASGIEITGGGAGSSYDFGTKASPGGNTFTSNNTASSSGRANLALLLPAGVNVPAVGNTWQPGVQNAAPEGSVNPPPGRYVVAQGETVLEVTGATTGQNYVIGGAGAAATVLRLAEQ